MTDSSRTRFRLPHWGWFLLTTVVVVVAGVGLSVWLPYHREQQVIQMIEGWPDQERIDIKTETVGPELLRKLVGDSRLSKFKVFERAVVVALNSPTITDADVARLSGLSKIRSLSLDGTSVTDAGLVHLGGMSNLKSLSLDGTAVTDSGLAHLGRITKLEGLYISDTVVTDSGLARLTTLKNLMWLNLFNTAVTKQGVEDLKRALSDCTIIPRDPQVEHMTLIYR